MEAIFGIIGAVLRMIFAAVLECLAAQMAFAGGKGVSQSFRSHTGLDDFKVRIKDEEETFDGAEEPTEIKNTNESLLQ